MKKAIVSLFFVFILLGNLFAQDQEKATQPKFWFGPKIGLDLATPTTDQNAIRTQFNSNSQLGIFFQFGRKFYLQPEFYYAMHKESNTISNVTTETTVNTLRIPVMLALRLINLRVVSAHVMAGPQGSFFLNETKPITGLTRQSNNFDLQFGGGVDLLGFITLDVRYSANLDNSLADKIQQLNWKDAVNVTLGLKFR